MGVISSGTYRLVVEQITSLTGPWKTWRGNVGAPGGSHYSGPTVTGTTDVDAITATDWTAASSSASSRAIIAGAAGVNDGPYDFQVTFDDDLIYLNADVLPTARIDLPSGFTPTAALVVANVKSLIAAPLSSVYLHFVPPRQSGVLGPTGTLSFAWAPPPPVPKILNLLGDGAGLRIEFNEDPLPGALVVDLFHLTGTYDVIAYWWTIPAVSVCGVRADSHLQYVFEDPGAPWVRLDPDDPDAAPTPTIESIQPDHGVIAGGTPIEIHGSGFGDGCTVAIDGVPATSVVVVSQFLITCTTPAHAAGLETVVVTNEDGATS